MKTLCFRSLGGTLVMATVAIVSQVAVAGEKSVKLEARWKKGEKYKYKRTKARLTKRNERIVVNSKGQTDLTLEVLDADKNGYLLGWKFGKSTSADPRLADNPIAKKMSNIVEGIQFQLKLNPAGAFRGVKNIAELKKSFRKVVDSVIELRRKTGTPEATLKKTRSAMEAMLLSKQGIEGVMAKEPRLFLMVMGIEFKSDTPLRGQTRLLLPLGNLKVPAKVEYQLKSLDKAKDRVVISYRQEVDPKAGAAKVLELLKKIAETTGSPAPKGDPLKQLSITDTAELEFELSTGWPLKVKHTRMVYVPGASQRDIITIQRESR